MLAYASLYPFQGWRLPEQELLGWLALKMPAHSSKSDLLVNVIAYVPFGFLLLRLCRERGGSAPAFLLAAFAGTALSFAMELTQTCLPNRNASSLDLLTNSFGTVSGALLALFWQGSASSGGSLGRWRESRMLPGPLAEIGILVVLCWALSQLAPFVPSLDLGGIRNALKPLWYTAHDLSLFRVPDAFTYCCYLSALGLVAKASLRQSSLALPFFLIFAGAVLCAKIFVLGRQISTEALGGLLAAAVLLAFLSGLSRELRCYGGVILVLAGFATYELKGGGGAVRPVGFNWVPFRGQLVRELNGFGTILEGIWPFAALSLFLLSRVGARRGVALTGGIITLLFVFLLEWRQLAIPGRTAEITQALLALTGWLAPFFYFRYSQHPPLSADTCEK